MTKQRDLIFFTISYIAGLIAYQTYNMVTFSVIIFIILLIFALAKKISSKAAFVFMLSFCLGIFNSYIHLKEYDFLSVMAPQTNVEIEGKIQTLPSSSSQDYTKFYFSVNNLKTENKDFYDNIKSKTIVTLFDTPENYTKLKIGDKLHLKGRLTAPKRASNPSEFSYTEFLERQNTFSRFYVQKDDYELLAKPEKFYEKILPYLSEKRKEIISLHAKNIKSPNLELLGGIVFGDDAVNPTPEMQNSFRNSGLTHIISASGMNVTLIFGMWFFISQILRINYKASILIGIVSVISYTCMTGFGPPVIRASIAMVLILIGKLIDRQTNSASLLFFVALLMLIFEPSMIFNIGFQLSFTVTLGLLLLCPLIFDKIQNKFINTLLSFIIVPAIAQIVAAPIQMYYFNTFSPYSILANICVIPMLSGVSFIGFISSFAGFIKPIAPFIIFICDKILNPFLSAIIYIADFFSNLSNSQVTVKSPTVIQMILYYILLVCVYFAFTNRDKIKQYSILAGIALTLFCLSFINFNKSDAEIIVFDVGNADSALISTKGQNMLIDTGKMPYQNFSPSAEKIMIKFFEDKGIKNLDFILLTHFDSDHSGGTEAILNKIPIKTLFVNDLNDNSPMAQKIYQLANLKNTEIILPNNNSEIFSNNYIKILTFYEENGTDNEKSLINLIKYGNKNIVFTGDAKLKTVIDKINEEKIDIIKIPHHGAKDDNINDFIEKYNPDYAIISTGFNIYGHPSKEIIETLNKNHVQITRTDENNAIKIILKNNEYQIQTFDSKRKRFNAYQS